MERQTSNLSIRILKIAKRSFNAFLREVRKPLLKVLPSFGKKLTMKHFYLLAFMICGGAFAQPTLTELNYGPVIGDEFDAVGIPWDGVAPSEGASQTWDYSGLVGEGASTTSYLELTDCPEYESFPGANNGSTSDGVSYGFNLVNADGITNYGYFASDVTIFYSDPEEQMVFPFTYEDNNSDDFHSTFVSGVTWERGGTTTITAIGYGSLALPTSNIDEVLLVKMEQDYGDSIDGSEVFHYNSVLYYFIRPGVHQPVLSFSSLIVAGGDPILNGSYLTDPALKLAEENKLEISIYPNPVQHVLNLSIDQNVSVEKVEIYDMSGAIVYSENTLSPSINTDTFRQGVYYLRVQTSEGQFVEKFVKS